METDYHQVQGRFTSIEKMVEEAQIRKETFDELEKRVAEMKDKEMQMEEISSSLLRVNETKETILRAENNFIIAMNKEKEIQTKMQEELNKTETRIEGIISRIVYEKLKEFVPKESVSEDLIKLVSKEDMKTVIIHKITNTDNSINIFKLELLGILFYLVEKLDYQCPKQYSQRLDELHRIVNHVKKASFGFYKTNICQ